MFRILFSMIMIPFSGSLAHAHWGHVGEMAGHGHIIAVGALVGAAALAAALLKPREEAEVTEEDDAEIEAEGEAA